MSDPIGLCRWCHVPRKRRDGELLACGCAPSIAAAAGAALDPAKRYCRDCVAPLGGMLDYHHCMAIVPTPWQASEVDRYERWVRPRAHGWRAGYAEFVEACTDGR